MFEIFGAEFIFSMTYGFGKLSLAAGSPFFLSAYRTFLGSLILLAGFLFTCPRPVISKSLMIRILVMGFFYNFLAVGARFWALQYVTIAKASLIYNLSPFITVIISFFILGHKITRMKLLGLMCGFLGFIPVFYSSSAGENSLQQLFHISSAEAALALASLSFVIGNFIFKDIILADRCHYLFASALSMLCGSFMHAVTSYFCELWQPLPIRAYGPFFLWATLLMISSNIFSYVVYGKLMKRYTPSVLTFAGLLVPIFSTMQGVVFLSEPFEWYIFPSLFFIGIGFFIFYQQEQKLGYM